MMMKKTLVRDWYGVVERGVGWKRIEREVRERERKREGGTL